MASSSVQAAKLNYPLEAVGTAATALGVSAACLWLWLCSRCASPSRLLKGGPAVKSEGALTPRANTKGSTPCPSPAEQDFHARCMSVIHAGIAIVGA